MTGWWPIVSTLLEYSWLGQADSQMTLVSLDEVLDEIEEMLAVGFAEAGVQLRLPMRLGVVSGDRIRLEEVLINLIGNALTYAAPEPPRWVEVGGEDAVPPDGAPPVRAFYVRDNGIATWAGPGESTGARPAPAARPSARRTRAACPAGRRCSADPARTTA